LGFTDRHAYYKAKERENKKLKESTKVLELVKDLRHELSYRGTRKLYPDLKPLLDKEGIKMGWNKVHQVLKDHDQLIKPAKQYN